MGAFRPPFSRRVVGSLELSRRSRGSLARATHRDEIHLPSDKERRCRPEGVGAHVHVLTVGGSHRGVRKITIVTRNGSVGRHRRRTYEDGVVMGGANGQPLAVGGPITPAESFNVEIPLKSSWDEPLTYAVLDEKTPDADGRVFVGRMELLGPLVNAIGHPGRGGTYLISGYRGAGKTSLIIKAASQAGRNLPEGWQLLPIVLNVSQVSASLGSGEGSEATEALQISSRRLLTA